ncbi:hypothetical protein CGCVW01_v008241 [Colletotrichum viniferum]|nr:hypothetical protein CGCVW01_v008241 [Colletotrichum viniferum]
MHVVILSPFTGYVFGMGVAFDRASCKTFDFIDPFTVTLDKLTLFYPSPIVEVHIASQARLKGPTSRLVKQLTADLGSAAVDAVKFHEVAGLSHFDSVDRPGNPTMETWLVNPNFSNFTRNMLNIAGLALPWSPAEFVEIYRDLERVWNDVKPDVTVAEAFFAPALTFCNRITMDWIVLAPITIKAFALPLQPKVAMLWKYPV